MQGPTWLNEMIEEMKKKMEAQEKLTVKGE